MIHAELIKKAVHVKKNAPKNQEKKDKDKGQKGKKPFTTELRRVNRVRLIDLKKTYLIILNSV